MGGGFGFGRLLFSEVFGLESNRTPMPIENRAAQFAPFAALSGHEEAISETSRLTTKRIELTNEEKIELSKNIAEAFSARNPVTITYFIPDNHKEGGRYTTTTGIIIKIDETDKPSPLAAVSPSCYPTSSTASQHRIENYGGKMLWL